MVQILKFIEKCVYVVLILFIIRLFFMPTFNRPHPVSKKRMCISCMKTIEGAAELYKIEAGTDEAKLNIFFKTPEKIVEILTNEGYLKTAPRCPAAGRYKVFEIPDGQSGTKFDVSCDIHGDLSKQDGAHKTMGEN